MGLVVNTWAAILFGSANASNQRRMFFYAGLVIIFSGFFDLVDGQVARATNRVTRFGAFFDSVVDRYCDASQFSACSSSTPAADASSTSSSPPSSWSAPSWSATPEPEPKV